MSTPTDTHPQDKSAAELEREVEAKRAEVEDNLDELQHRLSPGQLMDQLFDYAKHGNGAEFTRNLGRSVRDNPMPVALIGAGMAWLMAGGQSAPYNRRRGPYDHDDDYYAGRDWDDDWYDDHDWDDREVALGAHAASATPSGDWDDTAQDRSGGLKSKAGDVASKAGDMADGLKDRASAAGERVGETFRDARQRTRDQGRRMRRGARYYRDEFGRRVEGYGRRARRGFFDTLEEQPLVLGAIGVAVGAALGAALPATEYEDEWMGETRDQLKRQAEREGRRQLEEARDVADAAYGAAKEEAERQGLHTDTAKSAADDLRNKASTIADAAETAAKREASTRS